MSKPRHSRPTAGRRAKTARVPAPHSLYRRSLRYEPLEDRRLLAVVTVNTLSDVTNLSDNLTTLREAIFATNLVAGADTIEFAPSLTANGPATIALKEGEIKITDSLAINGPGSGILTIDASGSDPTPNDNNGDGSRLLSIDDGTRNEISVSLSGLTLTGGDVAGSGGAILSNENLTVTQSALRKNAATLSGGAIQATVSNSGTLHIVDSTISFNSSLQDGGGLQVSIEPAGLASIEHVTISNNTAQRFGGGINAFGKTGELRLIESSIANNVAFRGGGVRLTSGQDAAITIQGTTINGNQSVFTGGGAEVVLSKSSFSLEQSTISSNSCTSGGVGGLALTQDGPMRAVATLIHSTVTNNTINSANSQARGGISVYGEALTLVFDHTIIAGNHGVSEVSPDLNLSSRVNVSSRYSLVGNYGGAMLTEAPIGLPDANGNLIGGPVNGVIDPKLGPLADNGGFTLPDGSHILTHALLPGSPAINAGDLNAVAGAGGVPQFDERGTPYSRVVGGRIDIGAFEYQQPSDLNLLVDTLVDESDGNYSRGDLSLREAIELANLYSSVDTIHFDPALTANGPATILLTKGELNITDSLTINGPAASLLTIDASGNDLTPGFNDGQGSCIFSIVGQNSPEVTSVVISELQLSRGDNPSSGGAIANTFANLRLREVVLANNYSRTVGGGLASINGSVDIAHSLITGNTSNYNGGGAYCFLDGDSSFSITASEFSGNRTQQDSGGGIYLRLKGAASALIDQSSFSDNSTQGTVASGGGISITHSGDGGITLAQNTFAGNKTRGNGVEGGGVYVARGGTGEITFVDNTLVRNATNGTSANGAGAFLRHYGSGVIKIIHNMFSENKSQGTDTDGAGLYVERRGDNDIYIANNQFLGNSARGTSADGGGLYASSNGAGRVVVESNEFVGNTSRGTNAQGGGAIVKHFGGGDSDITRNVFSNNSVSGTGTNGGGLAVLQAGAGHANVADNTVTGNSVAGTVTGGLGIYGSASLSGTLSIAHNTVTANSPTVTPRGYYGIMTKTSAGAIVVVEHNVVTANLGGISVSGMGTTDVHDNIVIGNFWTGLGLSASGGGVIHCTRNRITGNRAAAGGGLYLSAQTGGVVTVEDTTIVENISENLGGGVYIYTATGGSVGVFNSTINNNHAAVASIGSSGSAGGIAIRNNGGAVLIDQCTISTNDAAINGGGIWIENLIDADMKILRCTITQNTADSDSDAIGTGGGVFVSRGTADFNSTIIAGNHDKSGVAADVAGIINATRSLIGVGANYLAPLADNGGPTQTHALLPGSPAINAGDPAAIAGSNGVPLADQRGAPFTRVYGGRIDIGAVESQTKVLAGDYNFDGVVDARDYVVWRKAAATNDLRADGNGDSKVDAADYDIWRMDFGNKSATSIEVNAASAAVVGRRVELPAPAMIADLAIAAAPLAPVAALPVETAEVAPLSLRGSGVRALYRPVARVASGDRVVRDALAIDRFVPARRLALTEDDVVTSVEDDGDAASDDAAVLDDAFAALVSLRKL